MRSSTPQASHMAVAHPCHPGVMLVFGGTWAPFSLTTPNTVSHLPLCLPAHLDTCPQPTYSPVYLPTCTPAHLPTFLAQPLTCPPAQCQPTHLTLPPLARWLPVSWTARISRGCRWRRDPATPCPSTARLSSPTTNAASSTRRMAASSTSS